MSKKGNILIDSLLEKGNIYKLKCNKCKSVSVQITENKEPDYKCSDCDGTYTIIK